MSEAVPARDWRHRRLMFYPPGLLAGAAALSVRSTELQALLLFAFVVLMVAPLAIKAAHAAPPALGRLLGWLTRRRLRATREGLAFMALTVLFGVAAINTGTNLLYLLLSLLLSMIVASGILSELDLKGLRLARQLPGALFAGEPATLTVLVDNPRRFMPALVVEIAEISGPFGAGGEPAPGPARLLARLEPGERRALTVEHTFARRGVFRLEGFELRTRFPFGFFVKYAYARLEAELVVFPAVRPLARGVLLERSGAPGRRQARPVAERGGEEFRALRPYRPGDSLRWIHWRATARRGELMVKELEPRTARRAAVVLDGDAGGELDSAQSRQALDRATTLLASLVAALGARGAAVEVVLLGAAGPRRPAALSGRRPSRALLEALARLQPAPPDPGLGRLREAARPALRRRAELYVVTARPAERVRAALGSGAPAAALRVLEVADPVATEAYYAPGPARQPEQQPQVPAPVPPGRTRPESRSAPAHRAGAGPAAGAGPRTTSRIGAP
ncbi:MAG: hypothetical protein KatS3mg102_0870 [Planctomycetota bacterium]|nr:MAG: hypothetical protein KatS3mg102_0870 [Planctomycetota bacterium]